MKIAADQKINNTVDSNIFAYGLTEAGNIPSYSSLMKQLGQPSFRAKQLAQWLWVHKVASYNEMTNLSADLRAQLKKHTPLQRATVEKVQQSKDGTRKYLLHFADGVCVEVVGLPSLDQKSQRLTVCISAQAGCALKCSFCATGQSGLIRNLLPGEIAEQVRIVGDDFDCRVSNVVVMGQGEPFQNYDATLAGLRILNAAEADGGFEIGARHITVSTAGIIKGIERLSTEPEQFTLAVSLHSAVQATRDTLMPGLQGQTLEQLEAALIDYYAKTNRRPSLEYALIDKVNTTGPENIALIKFAKKTRAHVNLIPLNAIDNAVKSLSSKKLKPAGQLEALHLANTLRPEGIPVTVRARRGADIDAACGMLKGS